MKSFFIFGVLLLAVCLQQDSVFCCNQRAPNPNFSRLTLQVIRENKERLLNGLSGLAEPIADKVDSIIEAVPNNIGGQIGADKNIGPLEISGNADGEIKLNNDLNSLGLGSLGGFLTGQNVIDFVTALNGWKNMSLDARALADIFSRGVFIPFGNFSVGLNTEKTTTAAPKTTTEKCITPTPKPSTTTKPTTTAAPVKKCQCGSNPCSCNKNPKEPCQCGTSPCTCNQIPKKPCQCGTSPCTCNNIPKEPCQCGSTPCSCNKIVKEPCEDSEEIKFEAVGNLLTYLKKKACADNCS